MKVENDSLFQGMCSDRSLAESSIQRYRLVLQKYVDFNGMSLEELITEAEDDEDTIPRLRKRKITERLSKFKEYLNHEKNSDYYINHQMSLVRSFYFEFDIQLPRIRRSKTRKDKKQETIEDLPTMDDIRKSLERSNTTYKAIILLMLSSGMSRSEIPSLTFKHYYGAIKLEKYPKTLEELIDVVESMDTLVPYWRVERVKTGNNYFTFSSPEASDMILKYLKELHRACPDYIPKPEDTFFRPYNIPITPDSVSQMFKRINKRAGLRRNNGKLTVRPHLLRKVFSTTLEKNKFPHLQTRWLMGHSIDSTTAAYFKADPEAIKEDYIEIVNHLTVYQEIEPLTVTSEGFKELKAELNNERKLREESERKIEAERREMKEWMEKKSDLMEKILRDKGVQEELDKI